MATGFGYDPARRAHQAAVLARADRRRSATSAGSARPRWTCAWPPRAAVDAYYEKGLNAWDHAAGGLVAAEAGLRSAGWAVRRPGRDW